MKIAMIVAMDEQGVIGKDNDLPWKISADLQFFKRTTMGKPIIMGRNTHESIGRPLPGRRNIVVTTQQGYIAQGCEVVHSVEQALEECKDVDEVMIMGGASLYKQCFPLCDKLYITQVHTTIDSGDTWFPEWDRSDWTLLSSEDHQADEKNQYDYSFRLFKRIQNA